MPQQRKFYLLLLLASEPKTLTVGSAPKGLGTGVCKTSKRTEFLVDHYLIINSISTGKEVLSVNVLEREIEQVGKLCVALECVRLLGPEKASRIVNPPILEKPISPPVQRLLVAGIDMGAEELWRALHEEPKCRRQLAEAKKGCLLSHQVPWLGCPVSTPRMQQVAHWRQQLHTMHRLGKQRQRTASCLLATKHITDLSDPYGTEGPTWYLHCNPGNKQVLVHTED
ncbi:UNVERIFIED_CONTAM: hypothetical protein K2H54_058936 [Gekko kuhli]